MKKRKSLINSLNRRENEYIPYPLKKIYFPSSRQTPRVPEEDLFIHLENSNLKGKNIIGDLNPLVCNGYQYFFCYSEDTFDEEYKKEYPDYFLDPNAPEDVKILYYNIRYIALIDEKDQKYLYYCKKYLDYENYLKYYEFLRGKYLGNFNIQPSDLLKIQLTEKFGIEGARYIFEKARTKPQNFYAILRSEIKEEPLVCYNPYPSLTNVDNNQEAELALALIKKYSTETKDLF